MATSVVHKSTGYTFTDQGLLAEYNKLTRLRNDIAAKRDLPRPVVTQVGLGNALSGAGNPSSAPLSTPTNGYHRPNIPSNMTPAHAANSLSSEPSANMVHYGASSIQKLPSAAAASSDIDPIFLTKSDVLVRAERRQRIERALEEQMHQKKQRKFLDQDTLPDFNVMEVLKKAQELVKPLKLSENDRNNGSISSSDSFDENTFYSSQMNDSTTTEEAAESPESHSKRICDFLKDGKRCINGRNCTFSHDLSQMQNHDADRVQAKDLDKVNADEHARSRHDHPLTQAVAIDDPKPHPPTRESPQIVSPELTEKERMMQERIAQLEAELRSSRAKKLGNYNDTARHEPKETHDSQEESAYSPPPPDEFGRDTGLREPVNNRPSNRRISDGRSTREYDRRFENPPSPIPFNMRVIRNHITSPVAPQPARVSPLAMAKVPQVSQLQHEEIESRRPSRASNAGKLSAGQSPTVLLQPPSSKKRRRGRDSKEESRNVIPRRDLDSPGVRVKDEPISPPPFASSDSGHRRVQQRTETSRRLYVDAAGPQYREEEPMIQQPRIVELNGYSQVMDDRGPLTPIARRVFSQNGQHHIANEERDLRRVVSARHVRAPISPTPYPVQYSAPQPRAARAVSQIYVSPTGQDVTQLHRASVQPYPAAYVPHERSLSPPLTRIPLSPTAHQPIQMAPPPRRIIVDQWGNRFLEAPAPLERHVSIPPGPRGSEYEPRYEQIAPLSASVRYPQLVSVDEGQYIHRAPSAIPYEYTSGTRIRQVVGPRGNMYEEREQAPRNDSSQIAEFSEHRQAGRYTDTAPPPERVVRMQSVRPVDRQYEVQSDHITRMPSVRPQPRIVNLGEKPARQVSVRSENGPARQMRYAVDDQPRYQYAGQGHDRGFVEDIQDDGGLYERPGNGGRRVIQRS